MQALRGKYRQAAGTPHDPVQTSLGSAIRPSGAEHPLKSE